MGSLKWRPKLFVTHCDVSGAQGLRRPKSCDVRGWCDVCPPQFATFAKFATFVGVARDRQKILPLNKR